MPKKLIISTLVAVALAISGLLAAASPFTLRSAQFSEGKNLPLSMVYRGYGCTGNNISPELTWSGEPAGTKSYAITFFDPDASTGVGWWHWTIFNIPGNVHKLAANAGKPGTNLAPSGSKQGYTDYGNSEYGGPCPPAGDSHGYVFTIYALNVNSLPIGSEATGAMLNVSMKEHILAKATLKGRYGR
ncbi:YbhB/YbcL family Raf kinase inhibitor-like protein [Argonema galeatum]|uniref:YbhB/YbcL family Raf kinase inhibitor-like protein n=1 Tax=Argonema galeatum TaxID=2942762 RepID=UPI0020114F4D|nr:YbhB/YbcL family Raf kinase inhibitor-like protein [Argonema galeatum]MCL1466749.1 YbhB/YbcL family Raf kinase inhibitor-like protein [Argonema galeatum A003/A1]